jgi:hypothetical protein
MDSTDLRQVPVAGFCKFNTNLPIINEILGQNILLSWCVETFHTLALVRLTLQMAEWFILLQRGRSTGNQKYSLNFRTDNDIIRISIFSDVAPYSLVFPSSGSTLKMEVTYSSNMCANT